MRARAGRAAWCLLLLSALAAGPAAAQPTDRIAAEALFREGREAAAHDDYETARLKFAESLRLEHSTGALFNLAYANEKTGRTASAWQRYHEVVDQLDPDDKRRAFAQKHIAELDPKLPRITVQLDTSGPQRATVSLDGTDLGDASLDVALPADPGPHTLVVTAPGRQDRRYEVQMNEVKSIVVRVEPGDPIEAPAPLPQPKPSATPAPSAAAAPAPPSAAPPAAEASPADAGTDLRPLGLSLGAVGLAGIVLGAVAGIVTFNQKSTVRAHCDESLRCDQEGYDAAQAGSTWATVSNVAFTAGVGLAGIGVYLMLRDSGASPNRAAPPARRASTMLVVSSEF